MNWKIVAVGGLVYFVATMMVGFGVTGPLIHQGALDESYKATEAFWRPELRSDPPDLGALLPRWMTVGLITAFITAAIFACVAPSLGGFNFKGGLYFGIILATIAGMLSAGWSGIFDLPDSMWAWWTVESYVVNAVGGAAMGWASGKFPPSERAG